MQILSLLGAVTLLTYQVLNVEFAVSFTVDLRFIQKVSGICIFKAMKLTKHELGYTLKQVPVEVKENSVKCTA